MFDAIRVVLVATTHPGNIGSAARAMKTMGLSRLYLVSPQSFPDLRANDLAAGADDVLANAVITDSLSVALEGCQLVLGTSARPRDIALSCLSPSECAELIVTRTQGLEVALLFGREHAGLTNDELLRCHYHIHIPTDAAFSSLNLAQAVQIMAYEIRMRGLLPQSQSSMRAEPPLALVDEVERLHQHLEDVLIEINFLDLSNAKRLQQRLRRLFNRAKLESMEVNILRGILTHVQYAVRKGRGAPITEE